MAPGRGSLGEVFPPSLKALFQAAATADENATLPWPAVSGVSFGWRIRRAPEARQPDVTSDPVARNCVHVCPLGTHPAFHVNRRVSSPIRRPWRLT